MEGKNNPTLRGIELFCGTKSFTKAAERKEIMMVTNDIDLRFMPDMRCPVSDIAMMKEPLSIDVFWASPPCTCFSVASIGTHWIGGKEAYLPGSLPCLEAMKNLHYMMMVLSRTKPRYWFIENPRGVMRKVIEPIFRKYRITDFIRRTVTYCQYGDERMKPTDIWTNLKTWEPKPMCKNGDKCHVEARRGAKTGTQGRNGSIDRSRIPDALCDEIVGAILDAEG